MQGPQPVQSVGGSDRSWTSNPLLLALAGFLVVIILGGALVAAALAGGNGNGNANDNGTGSGDEDGAPTTVDEGSTVTTASGTDATEAPPTTPDDDTTVAPLAGPTQGDIQRALLIAADVPDGWTIATVTDEDGTFCDTDPLLPPQIEASIGFDNTLQERILHEVQSYDSEATAISVFSFDRETVEGCPNSQLEQDGITLDVAASVVEVADLGDESVGFRLILTSSANPGVQIHIQFGAVRHGRTISSFAITTIGEPTAAELLLFDETFRLASNRVIDNVPR